MTLNLTEYKENKIFTFGEEIVKSGVNSIRKTASFLGNIVLCVEAVILQELQEY